MSTTTERPAADPTLLTVDEVLPPPRRRTARERLAAHPVATGLVATVLAAGVAFGGGYALGVARAADSSVVAPFDGTGSLRPDRPAPGDLLPGAPPGGGTAGEGGGTAGQGGVTDGADA